MYYKITELDLKTLDLTPSVAKAARSIWSELSPSTAVRRAASTTFTALGLCGIAILLLLLVSFVTGYEGWLDALIAGLNR